MPTDNKLVSAKPQNVILENCEKLVLSGVKDIIAFDEEVLSLETELGRLEVRGNGMQMDSFDTSSGDMTVNGRIYALVYTKENRPKSIFKRVFR